MAYEMVMPYHLHMPSYFLETFTEYPLVRNAHERGNFHEMIAYGFAAAVKKNKTF